MSFPPDAGAIYYMVKLICRVALLLTFAGFSWSAARPGDFRVIGPGGGGAMFNPTISPHDSNTALVSCDMTGAYITHDGGRSWRMFNLRGTVRFFLFDPNAASTIYAQATALWRSVDSGETWKVVYPKPESIRGVQMNSDHADETIVAEPDPVGDIHGLAVDPADSRTLFIVSGSKQKGRIFVSHDYGGIWRQLATISEIPNHIWINAHSLLLGGTHLFTLNTLGGVPTVSDSVSFSDITAGFTANGQSIVYGSTLKGEIFVSNGAGTFRKCVLPGTRAKVEAVATSLRHPETAYASFSGLQLEGSRWLGVAKTIDSGKSWQLVWKESTTAAANVHDAWITGQLGPDWGGNPLKLGVAQQNPNLCYATDYGRTMITTNGGVTWDAAYSDKVPGGNWTSTGLDVTTSYGFHFDPFDAKRQFITYTDIGLFRSEDNGRSWVRSTNGVPKEWENTTYWVEFDPKVRGRMWSVNSYTHDLPRPKMWRHTAVDSYRGGVCRSDDGGRTWVKSNSGMEETAPTHILLDPNSPANARVLYVAAFGKGVYKSTDGGANWALKNNGITEKQPFAWRLTRAPDETLYLVVARRSENGSLGEGDGALYRSKDNAENWARVSLPKGVNGPNGLAIDPKNSQRVYLAAWARAVGMHGEGGGVFLSNDAGRTWRQTLDRDQHLYDVTVDAREPSLLFAAGFESTVWKSHDRGEHWTRVPGFNFKWGHRVVPDLFDQEKIYVTTFGGSVWHGLVNGHPQMLDIATPKLATTGPD